MKKPEFKMKFVTARKEHECRMCHKRIQPGELYLCRTTFLLVWSVIKVCIPCYQFYYEKQYAGA